MSFPTFKLVFIASLTVSRVVIVIFLFFHISLFAFVRVFIVTCALDMLLIKATYLLTYLL